MARAATSTQPERKGMNRTTRKSTTGAGSGGQITLNVPMNADFMVIENIGSVEIKFVYGSGVFANAWILPVGKTSPEFAVNKKNTTVKIRSTGGTGDIQYMFWG